MDGGQNETRVFVRLPGLGIAVVHHAAQGSDGE